MGAFATQYLLQLDAVNEEEYVEVVGALLDVSNGQEIDRLEFRDYGTPLHAQQRSGSSGVFGGISDSSLNLTFGMASSVTIAEPLLGDLNLDGEVNGLDVDPFVDVLLSGPYQPEADMNEDQVVNGLDVDPFVASVIGGVQQIPEPATLLLALVALVVVGGWRNWGG